MATTRKTTTKLNGSRILIIGGSSGIGFGVAEACLDGGASVIISSSSADRVVKAIERLEATDSSNRGRVQGFTCYLGSSDTLEVETKKLFQQVAKDGKLDHIVYTAGDALTMGKLEDFTFKMMQQAGMVRFFGALVVAQQVRENLKEGPAASFTLTTGGMSDRPQPNGTVINSFLTGLHGMTRGLALDLAPIRVNLVSPGAVETELWDGLREAGQFDSFQALVEEHMITKTIGKVEDVAESYLYLMKDKNVTGSVINTNGGALLL